MIVLELSVLELRVLELRFKEMRVYRVELSLLRAFKSCFRVMGGGGPLHYSVTPVQTESQDMGVRSLEFRVRS